MLGKLSLFIENYLLFYDRYVEAKEKAADANTTAGNTNSKRLMISIFF